MSSTRSWLNEGRATLVLKMVLQSRPDRSKRGLCTIAALKNQETTLRGDKTFQKLFVRIMEKRSWHEIQATADTEA